MQRKTLAMKTVLRTAHPGQPQFTQPRVRLVCGAHPFSRGGSENEGGIASGCSIPNCYNSANWELSIINFIWQRQKGCPTGSSITVQPSENC